MDPITLATIVARLIATKAIEKVGEKIGEKALAPIESLRKLLWDRCFKGKPDIPGLLARVEKTDEQAIATLKTYLAEVLEDAQLKAEVEQYVKAIHQTIVQIDDDSTMNQTNYGGTNYQTKTALDNTNFFGGKFTPGREFRLLYSKQDSIGITNSNLNDPSVTTFQSTTTKSDFINCNIQAEIDAHIVLSRVTTLHIILSKDILTLINERSIQNQNITIDSSKKLIIQIIPKVNFELVDNDRIEIDSPTLDNPENIYFDLRPTHLGEGKIWIVVRQAQLPLLTLELTPEIVESKAKIPLRTTANGAITEIPSLSQPLHSLRISEQRNGTQVIYKYDLESPSLNILSSCESNPLTGDRQQYIENLYKDIESRWLSVQNDASAFSEELRAFGGELLDQLFPESLQRLLWNHRKEIQDIMVISEEPFIPWELVHLKPPGQTFLPDEVCFFGQMGLVRWIYNAGFPRNAINLKSDRCRYIIPHYPDKRYRLPQAEEEVDFLEQIFQAKPIDPQPNSVRRALQTADFDLLHFAGHGEAEPGNTVTAKLLLEGRIENNSYIPASISATTISQSCQFKAKNTHPIILLNACQIGRTGYALTGVSGFAQAFLKGGAGVFIGTLWSVGDRPARIFSETLYSELLSGSNLAKATRKAREASRNAGDATWLAYVVYGHPHLKVTLEGV